MYETTEFVFSFVLTESPVPYKNAKLNFLSNPKSLRRLETLSPAEAITASNPGSQYALTI